MAVGGRVGIAVGAGAGPQAARPASSKTAARVSKMIFKFFMGIPSPSKIF
jgi:hypothetical protein